MNDLTILCVTNGGPHAGEFLRGMVHLADRIEARVATALDDVTPYPEGAWPTLFSDETIRVRSNGCIESVLDEAIAACPDGYILRLDDDETVTPELETWLAAGGYRQAEHWAFPRLHLYPTAEFYLTTPPLYPDLQTRLSLKQFAGGRTRVHAGSPFGTGTIGPAGIVHHKFLCRPIDERRALLERYEALQSGAGANFGVFSVPEDREAGLTWDRVPWTIS